MPKNPAVIKCNARYQELTLENAVRQGTSWQEWELDLVRFMRSKGMPVHRIALKLNRTWRAVESAIYKRGL